MNENIELGNLRDPPPEQELEDDDNYEQSDIDDEVYDNTEVTPPVDDGELSDVPLYENNTPLLGDGGNTNFITNEESIDVLNTIEFLDKVVVDYPEDYKNPNFIRYLIRKHNFDITKTTSIEGNNIDYVINYYGKPFLDEDNSTVRPAREYSTDDGEFSNDLERLQFENDMDYLYDKWKDENTKKRIKKAGIVGGVLIGIGSLITGLALGLKRTGHSMVHDSKMKWKKLTPAEKKQIVIPWTELEKASGKGAIIVGDYIYIIIGGTILVYVLSK